METLIRVEEPTVITDKGLWSRANGYFVVLWGLTVKHYTGPQQSHDKQCFHKNLIYNIFLQN